MHACTIIARNYLAQARVLAHSLRKYHPGCSFTVLVVDLERGLPIAGEDFSIVGMDDLDLDPGEAERMALIYNVLELSTALKPWLLRRLLRGEPEAVLYFDPDIEIFASLSDLADLARAHSIVLTPHVLKPMPRDSLRPSETDILAAGIYNLGFIAVGSGSESFLDWWAVRLRRESHIDPVNMRFTDQRWVDFVPALFPHHILRDPACNVAYWNLDQRKLTRTTNGYRVDGQPLRFFHYSGYKPDRPQVLSKFQGDAPRVLLENEPAVAAICDEYRQKLFAAGYPECRLTSYGFGSFGEDKVPIDSAIRKTYRTALLKFEAGEGPEPPNAFAPATRDAFPQWLAEPLESATALITRYMLGVWEARPDIQIAYPNPLGGDAAGFYEWFVSRGRQETKCHPSLLAASDPARGTSLAASLRFSALQGQESVIGKTIDFGGRGNSQPYRLSGWSMTEQHFTWSLGQSGYLGLPIPKQPGALELQVDTGAFIQRPNLKRQRVHVYVGDRRIAEWSVGQRQLFYAAIPAETTEGGGLLIIEFRMPDAVSPLQLLRDNADSRVLGLSLYRLRLVKASRLPRFLRHALSRRWAK